MNRSIRKAHVLVGAIVIAAWAPAVRAQEAAQRHFERGYYLQTLENDPAGAVAEFEKVVADASAAERLRALAKTRLEQCREEATAADMARLVPANSLAYIEIDRPGKHVVELIKMLDLARGETQAKGTEIPKGIPIEPGFALPEDFSISAALLAELEKVRGLAVAITSIDSHGVPEGVGVIHPGESDLLRGLAETGVQMLERSEAIEGFTTYQVQTEVWLVKTARLFLVGRSKGAVAAAAKRLKEAGADSLATTPEFKRHDAERRGALAFGYLAPKRLVPIVAREVGFAEAMAANAVLDLNHWGSVSFSARIGSAGIEVQLKAALNANHKNLAYSFFRTAPASRRTLQHVPSGVGAVVLLGLNPATDGPATPVPSDGSAPYITAMDLGREFFANIEEVAAFVQPTAKVDRTRLPIPDVALVFGVKSAAQSQALWDYLLSLPSAVGVPLVTPPTDVTIEGVKGRQVQLPYAPPLCIVAVQGRTLLVGTADAVAAAIRAGSGRQEPIAKDAQLSPLVAALPAHTGKAAIVHLGRTARIVAPIMGSEPPGFVAALDQTTVAFVTDETPTEFALRAHVAGLPKALGIAKMALNRQSSAQAVIARPAPRLAPDRPAPVRTLPDRSVPPRLAPPASKPAAPPAAEKPASAPPAAAPK